MRALVVTNMYPTPERPALGSFVRDQVRALERLEGIELELFAFAPGGAGGYARGAADLRRRYRGVRFDVVHAHFGLTVAPSLAARGEVRAVTLHGTDLTLPRSRLITLASLRLVDLPAVVSESLAGQVPRWATGRELTVLPCGVDTERFRRIDRARARADLGLPPDRPLLLFPADPSRPEKRHDRALALAGEVPLLTVGNVDPEQMPLWVNAANAVLVTSAREGFGLAVLEALACDVPVLATPYGVAPEALANVPGTLCAPFELETWRAALAPHLAAEDPRVPGRAAAEPFSAEAMARRVVAAWRRGPR
jgi:glycosyltransferase involved in cell wall biosynthesis